MAETELKTWDIELSVWERLQIIAILRRQSPSREERISILLPIDERFGFYDPKEREAVGYRELDDGFSIDPAYKDGKRSFQVTRSEAARILGWLDSAGIFPYALHERVEKMREKFVPPEQEGP